MSLLDKFFGNSTRNEGSAAQARERLQIILAHERRDALDTPAYLPALQKELLAVISKYVQIAQEDIKVQFERQENYEVLEVNITLPER